MVWLEYWREGLTTENLKSVSISENIFVLGKITNLNKNLTLHMTALKLNGNAYLACINSVCNSIHQRKRKMGSLNGKLNEPSAEDPSSKK